MRVYPGRILQNVNISVGVRNSGEKTWKSTKKKRQRTTEKEYERRSQLGLANLAEFIFYSISGYGKLLWLLSRLS